MEEIIHTEVKYIADLEWVVREYIPAMDNFDEVPKNLVGRRNIIFSNIPQLLEFNRQWVAFVTGQTMVVMTTFKYHVP